MKKVLFLLGVLLAASLAFAPGASAHAALESTTPASGAIVETAPSSVQLHFSEPVEADDDAVRVFDANRKRVDDGDVEKIDGSTIKVGLDDLDDGGYVVAWKVVSADGHPIGGGFTWRLGESSTAVDPTLVQDLLNEQTAGRAVGVVSGIDRFVVFAGLLLLVGGAAFIAIVWPAGGDRPRTRRLLWWSWGAVFVGTVLGIGLQGVSLDGLGLFDAFKPSVISDTLDTTVGTVWLIRLGLLMPFGWLLTQLSSAGKTWWRIDAAVIGLALVATPAFSGHADTGRWIPLAKAFDILHVGAGAVWIGGLCVLLVVGLRSDVTEARRLTERFSKLAFGAVIAVVASGTFQSVRQVTTLDAIETSYGRLLAVKIVIVIGLIGIASLTRAALQGRLSFGDDDATALPAGPGAAVEGEHDEVSVLRRLVGAEVAVALVVLVMTALLVDANPGYATAGGVAGPFDETHVVAAPAGSGASDVLINVVAVPGTVGPTDFHVYVDNPAGGLTPPVDATGTLSLPSGDIAGIDVPFVDAGSSHWSANDVDIPIAGRWELTIEVLLTDVDKVTTTFTIPIGGSS
jgi:copper transport protein